ncbi:MAG: formate dehydrogenase subunit alpha, partial [Candidatus Syntrophonatronum acetioxidans]
PRRIELAEYADVFLQIKPGTNLALLNGLLHVIIKEGLTDEDFIANRTENFEEAKKALEKFTPEYVAEITGADAEDIKKAARLYAQAEKASILYTMGITQHTSGTKNVMAIANLAMATGNLGKESTGVNPLRGQNNVQGACDMGALPPVICAYQPVADSAVLDKFSKAWNAQLSSTPGLTVTEMFDAAEHGKVKAMYIMGENPLISDADINHVIKSLENLDFLVVQDMFLTETARYADVVLPACSFAEKDGTFTNTERRVQKVNKAIEPIGESKTDWEIITGIANKVGFDWNYSSAEEIFNEIITVTPSYAGLTYERLEKEGIQWPCPTQDHPGTKFLHEGKFTRGLGKFHALDYEPPAEECCSEYPFTLTTGRNLYHYHTSTMTGRSKGLMEFAPEDRLRINPEDAEKLGVSDGDKVKISSRRGEIEAKVLVTDTVAKGVVFMTFHFSDTPVNILTHCAIDPVAKIPELKVAAVNVEKAS